MYTTKEVAEVLGVHPRTVRRYLEKGQLPGERIDGIWRIPEEAISAIINEPKLKDLLYKHSEKHSEDLVELYHSGKHRLQQSGSPILLVFTFDPRRKPKFLENCIHWGKKLHKMGKKSQFDFTMNGSEHGLFRITLIAPPSVAQKMLLQLEDLKQIK